MKRCGKKLMKKEKFFGGAIAHMARGGDVVPAMLTPGEFVVNKKSAQSIGTANLNRMNVKGFASGGPVGSPRHFALGGTAGGGIALMAVMPMIQGALEKMAGESEDTSDAFTAINTGISSFLGTFIPMQMMMGQRRMHK